MLRTTSRHHAVWCQTREGRGGVPDYNLAIVLLDFLELFGRRLNCTQVRPPMRTLLTVGDRVMCLQVGVTSTGTYFSKSARGWYDPGRPFLLSVESPLDASVDVGKGSYAVQRVRVALEAAYQGVMWAIGGGEGDAGGTRRRVVVGEGPCGSLLSAITRPDGFLVDRGARRGRALGSDRGDVRATGGRAGTAPSTAAGVGLQRALQEQLLGEEVVAAPEGAAGERRAAQRALLAEAAAKRIRLSAPGAAGTSVGSERNGGHARGSGGGRGDLSDDDENTAFGGAVVPVPADDDDGSSDGHDSANSYLFATQAGALAHVSEDDEARCFAVAAAAYAAASMARGVAHAAAAPRFEVSEDTTVYGHLQEPPVDASDGEAPPPTLFGVSLRRPRLINRLVTRRHITHPKPTE